MFKWFMASVVFAATTQMVSAAVFRIDVAGSGIATLGGDGSPLYSAPGGVVRDLNLGDETSQEAIIQEGWDLNASEVPEDQQDPFVAQLFGQTTGTAFFGPSEFFDCSGLLAPLCWYGLFSTPAFDAVANTFFAEVAQETSDQGAAFAGTGGILWFEEGVSDIRIGNLLYSDGGTSQNFFEARFSTVEVTRIDVVPLPATGWLLLGSIAGILGLRKTRGALRH